MARHRGCAASFVCASGVDPGATHAAAFAALPRRIAHLGRPALGQLLAQVVAILTTLDTGAATSRLFAGERIAATMDIAVDASDRSENT